MRGGAPTLLFFAVAAAILVFPARAQESPLDAAKRAFEKGEYTTVLSILEPAAEKEPNNGDMQLLLTKAYLQTNHADTAIKRAEKAVAINPNKSEYHDWLGQAYGEKASHAAMFSAYSLARKTQKEFDAAVKLDEHNYEAAQNLVEYDCTAPGMVGGGEEKAQPLIQKLLNLDASQGHYAQGNCRKQKKDLAAVDAEFSKSLDSKPTSMDLIVEMADYFSGRGNGEKVLAAAEAGAAVSPKDPRPNFFRAVGWILKGEKLPEAEKTLKDYLPLILPRPDYPRAWSAHYWLGRLYEAQKNITAARGEYETSFKLNSKYKNAGEALKRLGKK